MVDGQPSNDPSTSATAQATVTIRDVNDSPPTFNKKEYEVSLQENTAPGTPLAGLDMNVTDRDVGINSKFSLRLDDVSGVFEVEPKFVTGYSQVNIRVGNGTLDYENPNQRKFIILVIAEETETEPKLSSTATITVTVVDANDNKPVFEHESYTASISENALPGQYITTITAKDVDSGTYGDAGIRYSISGSGAELFHVSEDSGVITLADCHHLQRNKRQVLDFELGNQLNYTTDKQLVSDSVSGSSTEPSIEYMFVTQSSSSNGGTTSNDVTNDLTVPVSAEVTDRTCLDYETENTYFLSYKVS